MNEIILKYFYSCIGFIAIALGVIGLFLPLMPTTCFLIVAVWAFSKSNPETAKRILQHPQFGPTITTWMKHKSIDRKVKCKISMSIVIGFSITLLITTPSLMLSAFLISGMLILLFYINSRPERNIKKDKECLNCLELAN
jgi:uncharacterized membrane protein YbaN (DUF454 family)